MATYTITTQTKSVDITKDGETSEYPFNEYITQLNSLDVNELSLYNKRSMVIDYIIQTNIDTIDVDGVTVFANAEALKTTLSTVLFNV